MPRIFDNIENTLLPARAVSLKVAERAGFCVGSFNLREWRHLTPHGDRWPGGAGSACRLLVGMHVAPSDEWRLALRTQTEETLDNSTAMREKRRVVDEFRQQLIYSSPSNEDEAALRQLANVYTLRADAADRIMNPGFESRFEEHCLG